jgi:integrase
VGITVAEAADAYLATLDHPETTGTRRVYGNVFRAVAGELGPDTDMDAVTAGGLGNAFRARWGACKPATWNANRGALSSLLTYCQGQEWIASADGLMRGIESRKIAVDRSRALARADIERILSDPKTPLRDKTLFRMLYETAARSAEVLSLNVEDLDLKNRRATVRRKGGTVDVIVWQTGTALLLPRLTKGRKDGPLFLTDRKGKGHADGRIAAGDLAPDGRARLSYRQAEDLFKAASGGATLHQLRHSALTHDAETGTSTPMLMAKSGHTSVRSLAKYARVSAEALQRHQEQTDPRRRG